MSRGVGRRCSLDPALLWLWCRPAATAPIGPLAWEPPCATGAVLKRPKKKKNSGYVDPVLWLNSPDLQTQREGEDGTQCQGNAVPTVITTPSRSHQFPALPWLCSQQASHFPRTAASRLGYDKTKLLHILLLPPKGRLASAACVGYVHPNLCLRPGLA